MKAVCLGAQVVRLVDQVLDALASRKHLLTEPPSVQAAGLTSTGIAEGTVAASCPDHISASGLCLMQWQSILQGPAS